ncbi:MAG: VOC family protein [Candidatus Odinarchaeota archaeon]
MTGMVFFKTMMLQNIVDFYVKELGMHIWLKQKDCTILNQGNLLIGFCERSSAELEGMITLFYPTKEAVDEMHTMLKHMATTKPVESDVYKIYHFFAKDPEGRVLEFQTFLHPIGQIGQNEN